MLPKKLSEGSGHENSPHENYSQTHVEEVAEVITEAQECTEASGWMHPSGVCRDLSCQKCKYSGEQQHNNDTGNGTSDFVRVKLSKLPSLDYKHQYFVRAAGGMSIPVPDLPQSPDMSLENSRQANPSSVPQLEEGTLAMTRCPVSASSGNQNKKAGSYLPFSVELVAGRSTTSTPTDSNRNSSNTPKVKSMPPSRTLTMSASLLKSYLIPSSSDKPQSKSAGTTPDAENSMKTKMMGIWNNVKYGWTVNLKTNFSRDSPVYLLASVYHKSFGENDDESSGEIEENGMEAFKRHFYTLIWCTYRRQFPILQDSTLTTDCGWGCMLRSGQMMVAHALVLHFLSAKWRHIKSINEGHEETIHRRIVQWLGDSPSPQCPLSLHNLVHLGNKLGKKAGDWYGPASVAYIFREAIEMGSKYISDLKRICVYVAQDCAVYIQDVLDLTSSSCVCNKGDLIKLSEESHVKEKSASDYLERLTSTLTSQLSEGGDSVVNSSSGSTNEKVYASGGADLSYSVTLKDATNRTVNKIEAENLLVKDIVTETASTSLIRNKLHNRSLSDSVSNWSDSSKTEETQEQCSKCENWRSVIIMVPVRLGGESLNPIYASAVCSLFTHDLCIGIIGGRPKHSLYFVGFQEEHLIHLDPHLCQDAVSITQSKFPVSSYHCSSPRKMALSRMDPSATLGFYCHTRTDFLRLMEELPELLTPKEPGYEYPIFEFIDGRSEDADAIVRQLTNEDQMAATLPRDTPLLPQDSEEFVFI